MQYVIQHFLILHGIGRKQLRLLMQRVGKTGVAASQNSELP